MRARATTATATATALAAALLLALTACGSSDAPTGAGNPPASSQPDSDTTTAATNTQLDAEQITAALAEHIPSAKTATVYTAESDPNKLLGRPGGYTSKADWTDNRAKPELDDAVQKGGSVEVYEDTADAEKRAKFIADILQGTAIFGTEYHYTSGGILLRVSGELTPDQAAEYEKALHKITG